MDKGESPRERVEKVIEQIAPHPHDILIPRRVEVNQPFDADSRQAVLIDREFDRIFGPPGKKVAKKGGYKARLSHIIGATGELLGQAIHGGEHYDYKDRHDIDDEDWLAEDALYESLRAEISAERDPYRQHFLMEEYRSIFRRSRKPDIISEESMRSLECKTRLASGQLGLVTKDTQVLGDIVGQLKRRTYRHGLFVVVHGIDGVDGDVGWNSYDGAVRQAFSESPFYAIHVPLAVWQHLHLLRDGTWSRPLNHSVGPNETIIEQGAVEKLAISPLETMAQMGLDPNDLSVERYRIQEGLLINGFQMPEFFYVQLDHTNHARYLTNLQRDFSRIVSEDFGLTPEALLSNMPEVAQLPMFSQDAPKLRQFGTK